MHLFHPQNLKQAAAGRLKDSQGCQKVLLYFCGILLVLCLVLTGGNYILDDMMADAGGLGGLGKRTMISSFQKLLPILNLVAMVILELGLWNAMLRVARGQYVSPNSLRMGLDRFFPWLRYLLLQGIIYMLVGLGLMNIAAIIFFATPLSGRAIELTVPLAMKYTDPTELMEVMMNDNELLLSMFDAVIPLYVILIVLVVLAYIPISYRLRLANLIILDQPTCGGLRAIIESFRLTKGNWKHFVKLDLSFWWYYVLLGLSMALSYLDIILALLGKPLPMSPITGSLLVYGLYLLSQIAIFYFLRPQVHVSTAVLYDRLLPKKEASEGVVLGNIFQM